MTTEHPGPEPAPLLDLERLVAGVRRRRRSWLALALAGLLAGALLAVLLPPAPTAMARVMLVHEDDTGGGTEGIIATDVALLETTRIAGAAAERAGADVPPEAFLASYEAEPITGNLLEITITGATDADALARAEALTQTFLDDHAARAEDAAEAEAAELRELRDEAEADLARVADEAFSAELDARARELDERAEEAGLGVPRITEGSQVVDGPRAVTDPVPVAAVRGAAIGFVFGLGGGLALAALATVVRDRPVLRRDIAEALSASVVAELPREHSANGRERVAATLSRIVGPRPGRVSLLELGAAQTASALALGLGGRLDESLVAVDHLPKRRLSTRAERTGSALMVLDGSDEPAHSAWTTDRPRLGVGSLEPGTPWTDLRLLGDEAVLVVRAGHANTRWLHTVARQLAEAQVPVLGVVLVATDRGDRSDGTLWRPASPAQRVHPDLDTGDGAAAGAHPRPGTRNGHPPASEQPGNGATAPAARTTEEAP